MFSYSTLPSYIGWIQNLSWLMYSIEALSIIQWVDVHNISKYSDPCTVLDTSIGFQWFQGHNL